MNTNFNKAVKGKARTGMSVVANKTPFIGIIDVGPMCMKMNDTFHDSIKSKAPNNDGK